MAALDLPSILQVTATAERRGAEVFASDLHSELSSRGWPMTTVALVRGERSPHLALDALGSRPYGPTTLRSLRHLVRRNAGVIAHGSSTLPATLMAKRFTRRPWIYRTIGDPRYWQTSRSVRQRVRLQLSTATRVVVLWSGAADALAAGGVDSRRIVVIPNGVVATRFPLVDEAAAAASRAALDPEGRIGGPLAVFLGSLSHEKGLDVAIRALGRAPDVHLLVAGDGPQRAELGELADRLAPGRVHFLGVTNYPHRVLAAADVLVVPSRTEGMAAVLIEAALSGIPVVATDVGAAREVVVAGQTGVIVPPGDPSRMVDGIREAIARRPAGPDVRDWCVRRFDLPVVAEAWAELLAHVVAR